jgi:hypothetical protein
VTGEVQATRRVDACCVVSPAVSANGVYDLHMQHSVCLNNLVNLVIVSVHAPARMRTPHRDRPLRLLVLRRSARVAMWAVVLQALNDLEGGAGGDRMVWRCSGPTDTGPILRLDKDAVPPNKQESYGNPSDRPIYSSFIPPERFEAMVASFFEYAPAGVQPKVGGRTWDTHALNRSIHWQSWR